MQPGRLTAVDSEALDSISAPQLRDGLVATEPDALATNPGVRVRLRSTLSDLGLTILAPGTGTTERSPTVHHLGDVQVVVADAVDSLSALPGLESDGTLDPATETYVLTDALDLSVRPTELTTVRGGLDAYRSAIEAGTGGAGTNGAETGESAPDGPGADLRGSYTHLSTALPADYCGDWEGLTVRGLAPGVIDGTPGGSAGGSDAAIASLELGTDGAVAARELRRDSLGLRAIEGVGEQRVRKLREAGYTDRESLAAADVATVADLEGVARTTAARLVERAEAFEDGQIRRETDGSLPGPEPILVDVETDGLSPSIVWLIGVLDREAPPGERYRSFLAPNPAEPAAALEAFCEWLAERATDRPIVAYNGDSFDFPVIAEQIERHCPTFSEQWADAWTFDPYTWAVRERNATLPGRTNRLADVAAAVGFDAPSEAHEDTAPLDGAEVARIYRSWMANPDPANEPDWEALESYCEFDVRARAAVYDAIAAADRLASETRNHEVIPETTQGSLGDFE